MSTECARRETVDLPVHTLVFQDVQANAYKSNRYARVINGMHKKTPTHDKLKNVCLRGTFDFDENCKIIIKNRPPIQHEKLNSPPLELTLG